MTMNSSDVTAGTNATVGQYNNLRKDLRNAIKDPQAASDAATVTFDLSLGAIQTVTLGGNRTLALSNPTVGQSFTIGLKQPDASGPRTVTWFTTIHWPYNVAPTLSVTAKYVDYFIFICTSTGHYDCVGQQLGIYYA